MYWINAVTRGWSIDIPYTNLTYIFTLQITKCRATGDFKERAITREVQLNTSESEIHIFFCPVSVEWLTQINIFAGHGIGK